MLEQNEAKRTGIKEIFNHPWVRKFEAKKVKSSSCKTYHKEPNDIDDDDFDLFKNVTEVKPKTGKKEGLLLKKNTLAATCTSKTIEESLSKIPKQKKKKEGEKKIAVEMKEEKAKKENDFSVSLGEDVISPIPRNLRKGTFTKNEIKRKLVNRNGNW